MATAFNLTAQINLQGPSNTKAIAAQIKKDLGSAVNSNVNININAKSAKAIENVTSKLKAMNAALITAKGNTDSLQASLASLSSSFKSVGGASSSVAKNINNTAKASVSATKGLKEASGAMESFGKQAGITIKKFAAYTIVSTAIYSMINAINDGYKALLQFDREMIRLQQITKSGSIGIKGISDEITNLSTSLGVSSAELAKVSVTLAQAGFTASQTKTALEALAKSDLAPSFENITKTTEGSIAAIRQFGLEAGELESALGSINAVASAFAVESSDIISAIQRTGGVFAAASRGVSEGTDALNEFVAVFTSVRSTTRESAETIATGLRTIFTRIQRGSTIDYLEQFNIKLRDNEGNFVGAYEAVKRLSDGLKDLDSRDPRFLRIVEELGGFRQIGKVIPLIQEFATAEDALAVAQRGQNSLTEAAAKAQQSLITQLAKVREEFQALVRSVGETATFKVFLQTTISLTSYLVKLANVFKPILPILAVLGSFKAIGAIGKFGSGFAGAIKQGGGAKGVGEGVGRSLTGGADDKDRSNSLSKASIATNSNTEALRSLTSSVNALANKIDSLGPSGGKKSSILGPDGKPFQFASGGIVPGSGNRDSVPALLTPGEVVINKRAANKYGRGNLVRLNKYPTGGKIIDQDTVGAAILKGNQQQTGSLDISQKDILDSFDKQQSGKKAQLEKILEGKNKSYKLIKNPLSKDLLTGNRASKQPGFEQAILRGLKSGVNVAVKNLSSLLGIDIKGVEKESETNFKRSLNSGAVGNLFEQVLTSIKGGGIWDSSINKSAPFDFVGGFSDKLAELFPAISGLRYNDARASYKSADKASFANKIGNQMLLETSGGSKLSTLTDIQQRALDRFRSEGSSRELKKLAGWPQLIEDGIVRKVQKNNREVWEIDPKYASRGGLIQGFAGGGVSEFLRNTSWMSGKSLREDDLKLLFQGIAEGNIDAVSAARQLLGKNYSRAGESLISSGLESKLGRSLGPDAMLDEILSEYEGQPIGEKAKAEQQKFADEIMKQLSVAIPTTSAVGPNIGSKTLEEAMRKGEIGSSLSGESVFFGEKLKKFIKAKDIARLKGKAGSGKARSLDARAAANLSVPNRQGEEILAIDLIRLAAEDARAQREMEGGTEADRLQRLAAMISEGAADAAEVDGDTDLAKRAIDSFKSWNSQAKAGEWSRLNLDSAAVDYIKAELSDPNTKTALQTKYAQQLKTFDEDFAAALSGQALKNAGRARAVQAVANAILKGNYAQGGFVQRFAGGGTVPAMVSNGEAYVPPALAKRIGYSKLARMNQADRNGMSGFASGGISVFRGAGHGTSDSIGPVGLPEGSFILRERATKALGLAKGGPAGFAQRFAAGGVGGLGYPGSMFSGVGNAAKVAAEELELLRDKAKEAGMSFGKYQKTIKQQIEKLASTKIESKVQSRKDIAGFLVQNRSEIKKAQAGSSEIENFKASISNALRDLDLDIPIEKIQQGSQEIVDALKSGLSVDEIKKRVTILKDAFDDSADAAKALKEAHEEMRASVGPLTDAMTSSIEELEAFKYKESGQAKKDFGMFGNMNPRAVLDSLKSPEGSKRQKFAEDTLGFKNLPFIGKSMTKLGDVVSELPGPIGNAVRNIGGLAGGVGILTSMIGSELVPAFGKLVGLTESSYLAGTGKALEKGGSLAVSFAALGNQLFGPQGAMVGLFVGAISGALTGFVEGFQTKELEKSLAALNVTMGDVEKAFSNLDKNRTRENIAQAQQQTAQITNAFEDFRSKSDPSLMQIGATATSGTLIGGAIAFAIARAINVLAPPTAISGPALDTLLLTIGATIGNLMSGARKPSELNDEALTASVDAASKYIDSLNNLAQREIKLKNLDDIKGVLDPLKEGLKELDDAVEAGTMTVEDAAKRRKALEIQAGKSSVAIEQAIFSQLGKKYNLDPTKALKPQIAAAGSQAQADAKAAADQAAYSRGFIRMSQLYGHSTDLLREHIANQEEVINTGYELLGQEYKQDLMQQELAEAYRQSAVEAENLLDKLDKVNAQLNRFGTELENINRKAEINAGVYEGKAGLGSIDRTNEAMLGNMRAYTDAELKPVIDQVQTIVGGQAGSDLNEGLRARRILQENLPQILSNVSSQDTEEVATQVRALFDKAGLSPDLAGKFADQIREKLDAEAGSRQGKSFDDLVQEFPALQESMGVIQKNFDVSANALKQYNDAIEQAQDAITGLGEAAERAREFQLRAIQSRIESENKLARVRGEYVGPTEENRAFVEQIRSLTGGTGVTANGQILVDQIKSSYDDLAKQIEEQRKVVESTQDPQERIKQTKKLEELNRQANNQYQALEEIANNTGMLDSLISAIDRNKQRSQSAGNFVEQMFTGSAFDLSQRAQKLNMYNRFRDMDLGTRTGQATYDQLFRNSPENRQAVFESLDYIDSFGFDSEQAQQRRRAQAQLQAIDAMRYEGRDATMFTKPVVAMEKFDPESNRIIQDGYMSIEDAIKARADGTYKDPLEERIKAQMDRQEQANGYLQKLAEVAAQKREDQLNEIIDLLRNLPSNISNATAEAEKAKAEAEKAKAEAKAQAETEAAKNGLPLKDQSTQQLQANMLELNAQTNALALEIGKKQSAINGDASLTSPFRLGQGANNFNLSQQKETLQKELDALTAQEQAVKAELERRIEENNNSMSTPEGELLVLDEEIFKLRSKIDELRQAIGMRQAEVRTSPGTLSASDSAREIPRLIAQKKALEEEFYRKSHEKAKLQKQIDTEAQPAPAPVPELNSSGMINNSRPLTLEEPVNVVLANVTDIVPPTMLEGLNQSDCCDKIVEALTSLKRTMMMTNVANEIIFGAQEAFKTVSIPVELSEQSKNYMDNFNTRFDGYVKRLEKAVDGLPDYIAVVGKHTVDVNIRGAEVFQQMEGSFRTIITNEIDKAFDLYARENNMPKKPTRGRDPGAR